MVIFYSKMVLHSTIVIKALRTGVIINIFKLSVLCLLINEESKNNNN